MTTESSDATESAENALAEQQELPPEGAQATEVPPGGPPEGEQAEGEESEGGEPEGEEKPRSSANERIRELLAREKATREYADYWRKKAMGGEQKPSEPEKEEPAPTIEQFGGDAQRWSAAYAKWSDQQIDKRAAKVVERQLSQAQQSQVEQQVASEWSSRLSTFAEAKPDALDVINNPALPISAAMGEVIMSSEKGPELAYHLGTNPGEAASISRMSPAQAAAAMGRLEAKLSAPTPKPRPRQSNAPPPPTPISGEGAATTDNDMTMPLEDFLAKISRRKR